MTQELICAIGDVHGECQRLLDLHAAIFDFHQAFHPDAALKLIHLGDYVDRGPDSCGVIEQLMALERRSGLTTICLKGNHEEMMLGALDGGDGGMWQCSGGSDTMDSYHRRGLDDVPKAHHSWLKGLPVHHVEEDRRLVFVHAGIAPARWPDLDDQIGLWTRSPTFFDTARWTNPALAGWTVIHGHTPTHDFAEEMHGDPPRRINIDTGAVYGGQLTAVLLLPGRNPVFLHA
ncbi:MAG: metallophosphoesterase family protein [Hyphomonas sp.]|uniref:metallophosphoesterase family protein n=1 Tax=Hyphomonas sp. TaxID=87 RepID=UPI003528A425